MNVNRTRPQRGGWTRALRLLPAVALTVAAALGGTATAEASVPAPPSGFTLTWSDDFNGASGTG
ncbi:hypothetical protein ACFWEE_28710, partial [Streptomyces sp. NPDC060184]